MEEVTLTAEVGRPVGSRPSRRLRAAGKVPAVLYGHGTDPMALAVDRLKNSPITRVVFTNTLPVPPEKQFDKIEVLSVAKIIADALDAVFEDTSVSEIFEGENQA